MPKKSFSEKCYELLKKVPRGKVTTYKILAENLKTKAYRAVGNAMNKNPYAPKVPCHRVVNSNGKIGGFASGVKNKIKMLEREGIIIRKGYVDNFEKVVYSFQRQKTGFTEIFKLKISPKLFLKKNI